MEFVQELFVTALTAVLFSFLVAKLVSMFISGDAGFDSESKSGMGIDEAIIMEELQFHQKLEAQGLEIEKKVEFVEEIFQKVDQFQGESVQVETIVESDKRGEETIKECSQLPVELPEEVIKGEIAAVELPGKSSEGEMIVQRESKSNAFVEERNERKEVEETGNDDVVEKAEEIKAVESESKARNEENKNEELDFEDDDDWEGIERTELEKAFVVAAKYVEESVGKGDLASIGGDVQMELYGLHKVATEGTCLEPQPMALKVSARTKWNAWQKLGNMSPEMAMEKYIALLSERISGWMGESYAEKRKLESTEAGTSCALATDLSSFSEQQTTSTDESCSDLKTDAGGSDLNGASSLDNSAKEC